MTRRAFSPLRLAMAGLLAMIVVVAVPGAAQAALPSGYTVVTYTTPRDGGSYDRTVTLFNPSDDAPGDGKFQADPYAGTPGDAIRACDWLADGWGIEIRLDTNPGTGWDRTATTRGYNSPYCSGWASGDIAEDTLIWIQVCMVKGSTEYCDQIRTARS